MAKKQIIFMHKDTGDIKFVRTRLEGQLLGKNYTQVQFTRNRQGENVMRFNFDRFTIDIMPNGERKVVQNVDKNPA